MNKVEKIIGLALLVGVLILGILNLPNNKIGTYIDSGQVSRFTDVNITNDLVVDGDFTTADLNATGAIALSGATAISGATTLSAAVNVSSATSTVKIGNLADGVGPGCLILGDSASATATPVYITATGATITATTTKPVICR